MKITLARVCGLIAGFPVVVGMVAMGLHWLLGCSGGVGPVPTSCTYASDSVGSALAGLSWMVMGVLVSVPLAILVAIVGKLLGFGSRGGKPSHPYGIYSRDGKLLSLPASAAAIVDFDRSQCEELLRAFGKASSPEESIDALRVRCLEAIKASRAYAV